MRIPPSTRVNLSSPQAHLASAARSEAKVFLGVEPGATASERLGARAAAGATGLPPLTDGSELVQLAKRLGRDIARVAIRF